MAVSVEKLLRVYKSKKGADVCALKDVSFNLPDTGMVFILGKSGCGKSTLLNILGGLDGFDGGDVKVDGQSIKNFKERDFDRYRNDYVGFIFQENNLLEKESVWDNIGLVFDLQGVKDTEGKIEAALESVELRGFAERKCNCLSGGQKQRVAIARALVKQPKLLLCDEPTGALDSETGADIFTLLKEVSRERLVVVVSHDRESAEKYGDRVIELKDGEIISDSAPLEDTAKEPAQENKTKKAEKHGGLRFVRALKTGASYIIARPVRMAICLLLCLITFAAVGTADTLNSYDRDEALLNSMEDIGFTYYSFGEALNKNGKTTTYYRGFLSLDEADELSSLLTVDRVDYLYSFANGYFPLEEVGTTDYNDEMLNYARVEGYVETDESFCGDYGFNLIAGRLPQNNNEAALPLFLFNFFKAYGYNDGEKTTAVNSYDDIIGKTIPLIEARNEPTLSLTFTITGVIDTHFLFKDYEDILYGITPSDPQSQFVNKIMDRDIDKIIYSFFVCGGFNDYYSENFAERMHVYEESKVMRVLAPFNGSREQKLKNLRVYKTQHHGTVVCELHTNCYNIANYCTTVIEQADDDLKTLSKYALYVSLGMVAVSALFIIYYVSGTLNEKRREIGILRALGASRLDILKIFACEYSIFTAVTVAVSSVLSVICSVILNGTFIADGATGISFISFGIRQFAVIFAVAVGAVAIGVAVSLIKLFKTKPVDIISDRKLQGGKLWLFR